MSWVYSVSLRVRHPHRDLSRVAEIVGMKPVWLWKVGDQKKTYWGHLVEGEHAGTYTNCYCCLSMTSDTGNTDPSRSYVSVENCVSEVIAFFAEKMKPHVVLWQEINITGGCVDFYISWNSDIKSLTEEFKWTSLQDLAELRISLDFDIIKFFPPDPEWNYDRDGDRESEPYYTYTVELRIRHPHRDLSMIPETLGLEPVRLWQASDVASLAESERHIYYIDSYCALRVAPTEEHVSDNITAFVEKMQPHAALWREITATGGTLEFFIGWDIGMKTFAEEFKWELLQDLVALQISLAFDIRKLVPLISDSTNVG